MEFAVPLTYSDLTLRQLQALHSLQDPHERVASCCNLTTEQLRKQPLTEILAADAHLRSIADDESGKHHRIIELHGKTYGFIPDWHQFTLGEWIDLEEYCSDIVPNAHKVASVLYREIDRRHGDKYTIKEYTATEDAEVFLDMPADVFGGMMLFFSTSRSRLLSNMRQSLTKTAAQALNSAVNGVGILPSTRWQTKMYYAWTRLHRYLMAWRLRISPSSRI